MNVLTIPAGATGVDYSAGRPDPALLKARGEAFVCRYLGAEETSLRWKAATLPELQVLWDHGIGVVLNGETSKDAALLGALRGSVDALIYVTSARILGAPAGTTIVCSHDTSAWTDQVPKYFRAAYDIIVGAGFSFGVYGSGKVIQSCLDAGMVLTIIWASASWAWPGGIHALAHIRQGKQTTVGGHLVDLNEAKRPFGAWLPEKFHPPVTEPDPPALITLPKDSTMFLVFTLNNLGVWLIDFTDYTITHLDGPTADLYQKLGFPNNFPEAQRINADELALLQAKFVGRPEAHSTDSPRQFSGTFTGSAN